MVCLPFSLCELFDLKHEGRKRGDESQNLRTFHVLLLVEVVVLVDHVVGVLLATFAYYVRQRNRWTGLRSKLNNE